MRNLQTEIQEKEAVWQGRNAAHARADVDALWATWQVVCRRAGWDTADAWGLAVDAYYAAGGNGVGA